MTSVPTEREMTLQADGVTLPGTLMQPHAEVASSGIVVFVHGSGSSRMSPRNRQVARTLVDRGMATLLFDLLTPYEAADRRNVFDIDLLARRVVQVTAQLRSENEFVEAPLGYFGASTGAAAALVAAAQLGHGVSAVVSRGGRPDLAGEALPLVTAPTLLLVGSLDADVLELNRHAQSRMTCRTELTIIPGAGHLFEEPGTMDIVADHAGAWFIQCFQSPR